MILLFISLQIYMLHIEILHIKILLLLEFSRQQPPRSVWEFSMHQSIYNYVNFNYFRKAEDWKHWKKELHLRSLLTYPPIFFLSPWYFLLWFLEQLFSRTTPSICYWWLVNSNIWNVTHKLFFMLRFLITYPQVKLLVVGLVPFMLLLSKYLFNACESF